MGELRLRASALSLSFGDLFLSVADESLRRPTQQQAARALQPQRFDQFQDLSSDVQLRVLGFLDSRSLASVSSTCSTLWRSFAEHEETLWAVHYAKLSALLCVSEPVASHMRRRYLKLLLLRYEAESRHFGSMSRILAALCEMPKGTVNGVVSNIGHFHNAGISLAVSLRRQVAMTAVILTRTADAITFRNVTDPNFGPVTFFSQENISSLLIPHPSLHMPPISAPGFLGYAVDLIRLDPSDEYMRYTFLLCAYKNLSVWESDELLRAALESGAMPAHVSNVSLDSYSNSDAQVKTWFRTGTLESHIDAVFVAFGTSRPRITTQEVLRSHMRHLDSVRDQLRSALVHFE